MVRLKKMLASMLSSDEPQAISAPMQDIPPAPGVQTGKMADPQGMRVYHEYFVEEDRGDGHYPWVTRVYTADGLHTEKNGLAASPEVARKQADAWGLAKKAEILGAA